jgi:hypothetical protein
MPSVVVEVAALTQRFKVLRAVVFDVVIQMRHG